MGIYTLEKANGVRSRERNLTPHLVAFYGLVRQPFPPTVGGTQAALLPCKTADYPSAEQS